MNPGYDELRHPVFIAVMLLAFVLLIADEPAQAAHALAGWLDAARHALGQLYAALRPTLAAWGSV